jgi:glutamine amidotransferase
MSQLTIAVVDYGMGNHASVVNSLRDLGFRVRVSAELALLDSADILVLPGVGAFPAAMRALHERGLVDYLQQQARKRRPMVGICLGMQLLTNASHEFQYTTGLGIIPGEFVPLSEIKWHIGWNTLECVPSDSLIRASDGQAFYFNHSFRYQGPTEYQIGLSRHPGPFASVIRRTNVVGIQFHPEKSQEAGRVLLKNIVLGLSNA